MSYILKQSKCIHTDNYKDGEIIKINKHFTRNGNSENSMLSKRINGVS